MRSTSTGARSPDCSEVSDEDRHRVHAGCRDGLAKGVITVVLEVIIRGKVWRIVSRAPTEAAAHRAADAELQEMVAELADGVLRSDRTGARDRLPTLGPVRGPAPLEEVTRLEGGHSEDET